MKRLGLLILLLGISFSGWCQKDKMFSDFGIVVGGGVSSGQGWMIWESSFSFILGVETSLYNFSEKSSIRAGVVFTKKGGPNYKKTIDSYNEYGESFHIWSDGLTSLYYMNFPILYQFKSKGGFYLEGGFQTGILLSAQKEEPDSNGTDAKDNFKSFDFSLSAGLGYWFNKRFSVGIRADFGLTDINSTKIHEEVYDESSRSEVLLGVVRFNF
jgi:hypothetical protein